MILIKKIVIASLILTIVSPLAFAKEYVVGFKPGAFKQATAEMSFMGVSTVPVRVFKNLELMIVDVNSKSDLLKLKADLNIEFVESVNRFRAPQRNYFLPEVVKDSFDKKLVDYPWGILELDAPAAWPHSRGGQGVKVLVLDSGIDKDHPNIASRFVEGRSFVSKNFINKINSINKINFRNKINLKLPYPYFDDSGHGTHVAGTILADGFGTGVVGVAPQASLYSGKVCIFKYCEETAIIAGIDWAIGEGMDVVNISLSSSFGNAIEAKVYKKAEEANVVVVAASGNNGRYKISYPARYPHVLSVGAIDEERDVADSSNWHVDLDVVAPGTNVLSSLPLGTGRESTIGFTIDSYLVLTDSSSIKGSNVGVVQGLPVEYVGFGKSEDFKDVDLTGKVALISKGEISFADKAQAALEANASAMVIFNNVDGELEGTIENDLDIIAVGIKKSIGERIVEILKGNEDNSKETVVTLSAKVSASDYGYLSGTSMAASHVSGVAALIRSTNPKLTAVQVKKIIKSSVIKVQIDGDLDNKYGKGIVNAFKAVKEGLQD